MFQVWKGKIIKWKYAMATILQIEIHDKNGKNRVLLRADSGRLDRLEIHFTAPF